MSAIKKITIRDLNSLVTINEDIGAEAPNVIISRDSSGDIITDLDTQIVSTTENVAETLKSIENNVDTVPTKDSTNVVTSGGIYDYIDTMITQAINTSY